MTPELTWTCHICKEERPDSFISVRKNRLTMESDVTVQENIRYCNDRASCITGSKTAHHLTTFKTSIEITDDSTLS